MTKIKILGDRIIFDGHAETKQECETITLMCNNLAKSEDFKTIKYENGYAEFEKIGNIKNVKDLMFANAEIDLTIVFDANITKVSFPAGGNYGYYDCTESGTHLGEEFFYGGGGGTVLVTLNEGYVIDNVTLTFDPNDEYTEDPTVSDIADTSFMFSYDTGMGGSPTTVTITSKKATAKQTIDVSTLSGWESLASGDHSITVKTKASGYLDSASSNAVTVSKGTR